MKRILITGLLCGTADIGIAVIQYVATTGKSALNVLRYIASGVFGMDAFSGGMAMAVAGLIFHFIIALSFTLFYFKLPSSLKQRFPYVINGLLYGVFIWLVMNIIVVPLSRVPAGEFQLMKMITGASILIVAMGIPIAWSAKQIK